MGKRFLCPKHSHNLKTKQRPVQLSTEMCTICRWEKRPWTLKDVSLELRMLSESLLICYEDPYYDPFGITFMGHFQEIVKGFLESVGPEYRKTFLEAINKLPD